MTDALTPNVREDIEFDLKNAQVDTVDRLKNQMTFAEKALAAIMLANGGALIAMFTFIGNTVGKSEAPLRLNATFLWAAFTCFAMGVVLSLVAHIFAFLSQLAFYNQSAQEMWRHRRSLTTGVVDRDMTRELAFFQRGNRYVNIGVLIIIGSLVCFVFGAGWSLAGVLPA
ncbi:hypothetical protein [Novosphingobium gossypii]|uniref:hypothetical protein n=1 Tax=Novosphingobium gossypii TaxID=1604774 RepID=UPI003D19E1C3